MLRRLGLIFAALAFFSIAGGHWAVLRTVAWTGMLRTYAQQTGSFATALEQTLDGQHPCELCLQIDAAQQQEAKAANPADASPLQQKLAKAEKDTKALPLGDSALPLQPVEVSGVSSVAPCGALLSRRDQPLTPPPRRVLA